MIDRRQSAMMAVVSGLVCASAASGGAEREWDGSAGLFNSGKNWSGDATPGSEDVAIFDLGGGASTVTFTEDVSTAALRVRTGEVAFDLGGFTYGLGVPDAGPAVVIGQETGESATLLVTGGVMEDALGLFATWAIRATGGVTLSGDGAGWRLPNNTLEVDGSLRVESGAFLTDDGAALEVEVGPGGSLEVDGDGSSALIRRLTVASPDSSRGSDAPALRVGGGARATAASASIADGGEALVEHAGSRLVIEDALSVNGRLTARSGAAVEVGGLGLSVDGEVALESGATMALEASTTGAGVVRASGGATIEGSFASFEASELRLSGAGTSASDLFVDGSTVVIEGGAAATSLELFGADVTVSGAGSSLSSFFAEASSVAVSGGATATFSDGIVTDGGTTLSVTMDGSRIETGFLLAEDNGALAFQLGDPASRGDQSGLYSHGLGFGDPDVTDLLGGTLSVSLLDGYAPVYGDAFTLIETEGLLGGAFDGVDLPTLGRGLFLDLQIGDRTVSATVVPAPGAGLCLLAAGLFARGRRRG